LRDYNTEIFRRKREILRSLQDTSKPLELKNRIIDPKILNLIENNTTGGISITKIATLIGMNRKNIVKHLMTLQSRKLVYREKGRQGRFFPTRHITMHSDLSAEVLSDLFLTKVLNPDDGGDILEVISPYIKPRLPYQGPKYDLNLERVIFDFSNAVGSFITYVLIQSMNQVNHIATHVQDVKEKDLVTQKWVADVISELQEYLLLIFKDYIELYIPTLNDRCKEEGISETIIKYAFQEPKYVLDNSTITDLTSAFSNTYPDLYYTLENIRKRWPKSVQRIKDDIYHRSMRHEIQVKCKHKYHEFRIPVRQRLNTAITRSGTHCEKCHRTIYKDKKK
jgi:DNA-binding transcriptional ArsR family regulator